MSVLGHNCVQKRREVSSQTFPARCREAMTALVMTPFELTADFGSTVLALQACRGHGGLHQSLESSKSQSTPGKVGFPERKHQEISARGCTGEARVAVELQRVRDVRTTGHPPRKAEGRRERAFHSDDKDFLCCGKQSRRDGYPEGCWSPACENQP